VIRKGKDGMSRRPILIKNPPQPYSIEWRQFFGDQTEEEEGIQLLMSLQNLTDPEYQDYFGGMTKRDQKRTEKVLMAAQNVLASRNLEYFASCVVTKDEHKQGAESIRLFPTREEKPYIWDVLDTLVNGEDIIIIEKSRQLLFTWACCLYCLWTAKYQDNRLNFIQSKKEENAANLVFNTELPQARISFMESNMPRHMQSDVRWSYCKAFFKETGSSIWGIPEGGDQIRSYTPSLVFSDEAAFQPEFENAWKATKPCVDGGGKAIIVSTAKNGAFMKDMVKTTGDGGMVETMKGLKHYHSDMSLHVIRCHYTADPMKDPDTEKLGAAVFCLHCSAVFMIEEE